MAQKTLPQLLIPFVGHRFASVERLGALISPPYDVISEERREALAKEKHNIVHLILPQGNGDRYEVAGKMFVAWQREGVVVREKKPAVYVVQQRFDAIDGKRYVRTGVLGAVAVESYDTARVRRHERTHQGPKEDRLALMRSTNAMFEALLMIAADPGGRFSDAVGRVVTTPRLARAELDGVEIGIWRVEGKDAADLTKLVADGPLYIADGHHRYETAVVFGQERSKADRTLALTVSQVDPGLIVLATHRILEGGQLNEAQLRLAVEDVYEVVPIPNDSVVETVLERINLRGKGCVVAMPDQQLFVLTEKSGTTLPRFTPAQDTILQKIDVAKIDSHVVKALMRAGGEGTRLSYSPDPREVVQRVRDGATAGVLVKATSLTSVLDVSDTGSVMPQKSTYFYPKVPSGLAILPLG